MSRPATNYNLEAKSTDSIGLKSINAKIQKVTDDMASLKAIIDKHTTLIESYVKQLKDLNDNHNALDAKLESVINS